MKFKHWRKQSAGILALVWMILDAKTTKPRLFPWMYTMDKNSSLPKFSGVHHHLRHNWSEWSPDSENDTQASKRPAPKWRISWAGKFPVNLQMMRNVAVDLIVQWLRNLCACDCASLEASIERHFQVKVQGFHSQQVDFSSVKICRLLVSGITMSLITITGDQNNSVLLTKLVHLHPQ